MDNMHYCLLIQDANTGLPLGSVIRFPSSKTLADVDTFIHGCVSEVGSGYLRFFVSYCPLFLTGMDWEEVIPDYGE